MPAEHYLVVYRDSHWEVTHQGTVEGPFSTRELAMASAVQHAFSAGKNGLDAEVRVQQDAERGFETAWKYGRDPVPPGAEAQA